MKRICAPSFEFCKWNILLISNANKANKIIKRILKSNWKNNCRIAFLFKKSKIEKKNYLRISSYIYG